MSIVNMMLPPIGLIVEMTIDILSNPTKYFWYRLHWIENDLIELTCIINEDVIRP